ncbi:MAG: polyphosphate kinase 2 family protein [Planctomycetes bacterium]|nr:polyphosphate kinase 2 family protein [Planctomycetota bacterium]
MSNDGRLSSPFRIDKPAKFRLRDIDPDDTQGLRDEEHALGTLRKGIERMRELQERLYAENSWALLLVFQAMDAAGKDSTIKHVMSGVNPAGCQVASFKAPSSEELDHDFLWRCVKHLPERGRIGIFNRSYYEEVLVVRVHQEFLLRQGLPERLRTKRIFDERLQDIACWERYLARNGVAIIKFYLHVSKAEQRRRFLARLDEEDKHWKFNADDVKEREHWDEYMDAYEAAIRATGTEEAPWYVVPADHKWFMRAVVADAIVARMKDLDLKYPAMDGQKKADLAESRKVLMAGKGGKKKAEEA